MSEHFFQLEDSGHQASGWLAVSNAGLPQNYSRSISPEKVVPFRDSRNVILQEKGITCNVILADFENEMDYYETYVSKIGETKVEVSRSQIVGSKLVVYEQKVEKVEQVNDSTVSLILTLAKGHYTNVYMLPGHKIRIVDASGEKDAV